MPPNFSRLLALTMLYACAETDQRATTNTAQNDSIPSAVVPTVDTRPDSVQPSAAPIESSRAFAPVPASALPASAMPVASLIDWKFFPGGDSAARVEVRSANTVDTLAGLFAVRDPLITRDGIVHGIATTEDGGAIDGFDYNTVTKKLTRFSLPKDINPSFTDIELNETANYVAYIAHTLSGQSWAVVRTWPRLELVARSDSSPGYPSDADTDMVGWADSTHYNLSYVTRSGAKVMVTGDARTRAIKVDSIAARDLRAN